MRRRKDPSRRGRAGILIPAALLLVAIAWPAACRRGPAASGPGRPDFSGVWKLDPANSNFAGETPPESKIQRVEQNGDSLDVVLDEVQAGRPVHGSSRYALDGQETVNEALGNPLRATVAWDDGTMVMRTWGPFGGAEILLIDRWTLAPDGLTLRMARHFEGHGRTSDQLLVFTKQ
jgi:hypothetical protein